MAFVGRWGSPENTVKKHELNKKLRKRITNVEKKLKK
jgi:hypothetical protein